ncbi:MAG: MFS transporter [Acidimicrobiales bacterium]
MAEDSVVRGREKAAADHSPAVAGGRPAVPAAEANEGTAAEADRLYARRWLTLLTLCLCIIVIGVDNTILNVALPSIVRSLGATGSQLQLIVDGYTIIFACLLLTSGSIGDRYGRRHALMFGLAWFGVFSLLASQAGSPAQLIAARMCMGIGGAFIFPTTLSILTNTFRDPGERARAIGIWAGVSGIGIALGPLLGGLLVERFGWGSVFLINVPITTIAIVLCLRFVPQSGARADNPLDPIGALLSILGLATLLYGIIEGPDRGWLATPVLGPLVAGVAFLALFAWWEWRNPHPMLDVKFFRNPRFSAASATITITFFALYASTFLMTLYFQFVLGYSPVKTGLLITPVAVGLMIASPFAPRFVNRFGTKRVVVAGLCLVGGCMACYGSNTIMSSFALGLTVRFVYGLGMGLTSAPVTESIMGSLPPSRAGVGSAVNDTTRQTGGALGVAIIGSVFAARYHVAIGGLPFIPEGSRAVARESIGGSLKEAASIGGATGAHLVSVAHEAFITSMRVAYGISVLVVATAVFVAWRFLPAQAPASQPPPYAGVDAVVRPDSDLLESMEIAVEDLVD